MVYSLTWFRLKQWNEIFLVKRQHKTASKKNIFQNKMIFLIFENLQLMLLNHYYECPTKLGGNITFIFLRMEIKICG